MTQNDILQRISQFFGTSLVSANVNEYLGMFEIRITYIDGIPYRKAYSWAVRHIPLISELHIDRIYSERTLHSCLIDLYSTDPSIAMQVERTLYAKNLANEDEIVP